MSSTQTIATIKGAVAEVDKLVKVQAHTIDQQAQQIAQLQEEKKQMELQIEMLQQIDSNDSDGKKVLVNVLKENKLIKDCEEGSRDELESALTTCDEMANAFATTYTALTEIIENNVQGSKNQDKVRKCQLKFVESYSNKVAAEHTGYHADTLATLLTQETHRIKMKQRKFKRQYLLALGHYHD